VSENPKSMEALAAQSARIHRLALAITQDRHMAEDLAQDAWVTLLRGSGSAPRNLSAWLTGTMGNLFRTRVRSERRRADHERANAREELEAGSASALERLELHEALVRAVRELKEPYRTTVLLRWFEDLEPLEIARRTGVPVRTVHTRVTRALEMLRAKLQRAGYGESWSMWTALAPLAWIRHAGEAALAVKTKTKILVAALAITAASVTIGVVLPRLSASHSPSSAAPRLAQPRTEDPVLGRTAAEAEVTEREAIRAESAPQPAARVVAAKSVLSGLVRVRGLPPAEPLTLRLFGDGSATESELARATVATSGAFEFEGVEAGFKGKIRTPNRYILAGSEPRQRSLSVEAPDTNIVLDLERVPCLTGRLVSRTSGRAVEDATVQGMLTCDDGGQMLVGADTGPDGRFYIATHPTRGLAAVEIDASSSKGLRGKFQFARDQIPPDLDLGVLTLDAGLALRIVVRDPGRKPIPGARAQARGLNAPTVETDAEGRATLVGLEPGSKVTVLARGFDPEVLEAPGVETTLEIVLERATRLTVRVVDPSSRPAAGVRMEVSAETPMFAGSEGGPDRFLVPQVPQFGAIAGQEVQRKRFFVCFKTDEEGVIALQSLIPGLPLQFSLLDAIDTKVLTEPVAPLAAHEVRELKLRLPFAQRSLAGVVEDAAGRPIERAQVGLGRVERAFVTTDPDGRFRFEHLFATQADLDVERRGYVNVRMKDVPIQEDGYPLRIVLEAGRDARVRVIDETEASVDLGSLSARLLSGERAWYAQNAEDGSRTLLDLPIQELEVRLELAGKTFSAQLGARQEVLELRVPTLGHLEVTCAPAPSMVRDPMGVRLKSLGEQGLQQWVRAFATKPAIFDAVLPGDYDLSYVTWEPPESDDEVVPLVPLGEPMTVRIEAGQTARVELR
jgi:RNA polymerase sigma factor (sigma-70 family)